MTLTHIVLKRFQLTVAALAVATVFTPLQAQMPADSGMTTKPAAAASAGMADSKMPMGSSPMGQGGDMKSKMDDMQSKMMAMKSTGDPDVDFAMMMRMHHQGAITMAETELRDGKNQQMKKMAKNIITAQKKEIAVFDKFLETQDKSGRKMGNTGMQMNK